MNLIKKILKVIVLMAAALSVPAIGLFGTMAFQALTTQNVGAVLVGAIFLAYFLIAAAASLILLGWVFFWDIHRLWSLILGLETGGLLAFILYHSYGVKIDDYRAALILAVLALVYGFLAFGFMRRAYRQFA